MAYGTRIREFDTWRAGYAGASVRVLKAGLTEDCPIYSDVAMTTQVANPQVLLTLEGADGATYGKWAQPVYAGVPYTLLIDNADTTGVERPALTTLEGADASLATVESTRGAYAVTLQEFSDQIIMAALYGALGQAAGASTSTTTLEDAIGAAAAQGGGTVLLPAGTIPFTTLTLPEGVVLDAAGPAATILQSNETGAVVTLGGDGAGLRNLCLDGINKVVGSIGLAAVNIAQPVLENVLIQRFETGAQFKGGQGAEWRLLSFDGCTTAVDFRGDSDAGDTATGTAWRFNQWRGGYVSNCTTAGVVFTFVDQEVGDMLISNVRFVSITGEAVKMTGARRVTLEQCEWTSCLTNLSLDDDSNTAYADLNTTQTIRVNGGAMDTGAIIYNGACVDVQLRGVSIAGVSHELTYPENPISLVDCIEDADTTATGSTLLLQRSSTASKGKTFGVTTDLTATVAWQRTLSAGQTMLLKGQAVGRQRNGTAYATFDLLATAHLPAAKLPLTGVTVAPTAGQIITGATSGASGRVVATDIMAGTGTVSLQDITGEFVIGEAVSDPLGANGSVYDALNVGNADYYVRCTPMFTRSHLSSGIYWTAFFDPYGQVIRLVVSGDTSQTVEWSVQVEEVVSG